MNSGVSKKNLKRHDEDTSFFVRRMKFYMKNVETGKISGDPNRTRKDIWWTQFIYYNNLRVNAHAIGCHGQHLCVSHSMQIIAHAISWWRSSIILDSQRDDWIGLLYIYMHACQLREISAGHICISYMMPCIDDDACDGWPYTKYFQGIQRGTTHEFHIRISKEYPCAMRGRRQFVVLK